MKGLVQTGLFPCNPPITPQIYANGKFFLYFSTLETNKQTKKHIYFFESFSKIFKKKNFELEMIQLGHLYSKNKVFSNMNTNFLDDEDDCNWYGDTGGGGGEGRRDSMMKEHEQAPITFPYARATNKGTKHCYFPLPDFSYLQCPDANRDAVALLHGEVRLLRRPGKGGRDWRDC